jgi:hypothetical protein
MQGRNFDTYNLLFQTLVLLYFSFDRAPEALKHVCFLSSVSNLAMILFSILFNKHFTDALVNLPHRNLVNGLTLN